MTTGHCEQGWFKQARHTCALGKDAKEEKACDRRSPYTDIWDRVERIGTQTHLKHRFAALIACVVLTPRITGSSCYLAFARADVARLGTKESHKLDAPFYPSANRPTAAQDRGQASFA
jgi:hypothetical protein